MFTPTVSYYSSSSVSSLPRIDEGKPASILNDETIAYADESFDKTNEQEKMATAATVYKSSESLKSSNLLRNTSEKHLRFASPVCELAEIDPLMENCSLHCVSFHSFAFFLLQDSMKCNTKRLICSGFIINLENENCDKRHP